MHVAIAGGHGQIALHLERELAAAGHTSTAIIRNPDHADDVRAAGAEPVVLDLEDTTATRLAEAVGNADAVVFAAGAGPNSGAGRKATMDRDGALLLIAAAQLTGTMRYVMVSAMGADDGDPDSDDVFQIYLVAKGAADAALRESELDWTVVRPGRLTNDSATGAVELAESVDRGEIPRADVAAVLARTLEEPGTVGTTFEVVGGATPIRDAVRAIASGT
ncbi:SDR family oxidoreductase [Solicola gregarius]|uniref:SDR family oxidoreductase n=1 Tax=Solicola gregarius TaxID=2908642 RepID=A0AA46TI04_9ACTN|nr:SDR family oxidoreductase [Solicola gregarius]UYM05620.1 SDR family oxidoreductase [Solicola gregarius]